MTIRILIEATVQGNHATITRQYTEWLEGKVIIGQKHTLWTGPVMDLAKTTALLTAEEADDHAQACLEAEELMPMGKSN